MTAFFYLSPYSRVFKASLLKAIAHRFTKKRSPEATSVRGWKGLAIGIVKRRSEKRKEFVWKRETNRQPEKAQV